MRLLGLTGVGFPLPPQYEPAGTPTDAAGNVTERQSRIGICQSDVTLNRAASKLEGPIKPRAFRDAPTRLHLRSMPVSLDAQHAPVALPYESSLRIAVQDVFSIAGRGTVLVGRVEFGTLAVGDEVDIVGPETTLRASVSAIERGRRLVETASEGDDVGVLFASVEKGADLARGFVIVKP